ncbi:hypothetical protein [Micromonospora sp. HM5-17]|jgi:hypothetical protein|uniref:hypothetical protein n=1 Tax=Micromonospora sp. HM5-17 TaxID=2487710 RepID=UPI000F4A5622|nr:hypothetical protein [Micromonospora sp. HM5-17]ROT31511.1 hypothetical protein EF879_13825 [Micromonospora sp. HM5-17]
MIPAESDQPAAALRREVDLLVNQVGHWTAPRWATPARAGGDRRADVVHRLVQLLADLCADAERRPRRAVPRLENDLALPDQLRVVTADLLAADPPPDILAEAVDAASATRAAL